MPLRNRRRWARNFTFHLIRYSYAVPLSLQGEGRDIVDNGSYTAFVRYGMFYKNSFFPLLQRVWGKRKIPVKPGFFWIYFQLNVTMP